MLLACMSSRMRKSIFDWSWNTRATLVHQRRCCCCCCLCCVSVLMNRFVALISSIEFNIHHREYNSRTFSSYATFSINFRCRCVYLQLKCMNQIFSVLQSPRTATYNICIVIGWLELLKHMFSFFVVCVSLCISVCVQVCSACSVCVCVCIIKTEWKCLNISMFILSRKPNRFLGFVRTEPVINHKNAMNFHHTFTKYFDWIVECKHKHNKAS